MAGIPVSGPGKFSRRTDRQPIAQIPNADYGEQKAYKQLQQDAPMAASPEVAPASRMDFAQMFGNPADRVVPMGADSAQPGTPVTDGASMGAGAGVDVMGFQNRSQQDLQNLASQLPVLEFMANQPGASWGLRQLVRNIKGSL